MPRKRVQTPTKEEQERVQDLLETWFRSFLMHEMLEDHFLSWVDAPPNITKALCQAQAAVFALEMRTAQQLQKRGIVVRHLPEGEDVETMREWLPRPLRV